MPGVHSVVKQRRISGICSGAMPSLVGVVEVVGFVVAVVLVLVLGGATVPDEAEGLRKVVPGITVLLLL